MSAPDTPLQVRVARKQIEADGICSLELAPVSGTLPPFTAGAHIDVELPAHGGTLVRQYSLCNDPHGARHYQIAVLRESASRGGSQAVHDTVAEGDLLHVSAPRNHFPLAADAPFHLLLAGGIGITPLLAMAEHLSHIGASYALHAASRSRAQAPFLERIAGSGLAGHAQHYFSSGDGARRLDIDATLRAAPPGSHLYVCGPQRFIDAALDTAHALAWPEARLHREYFAAEPVATAGDGGFELEIASSGKVIAVLPQQTALQALNEAGLDIPSSCEQGVCGTCLTGVKSGQPEHRDLYLTDEEKAANDQFLPCCSRARSERLVLDL
ncbi:PDR/VanB family oxidoreductase [Comamonadaceae bacterium G21597-S1]|nr:PDR/VanB family oxidoreductase [Comamonadaceae bacterium G21597-S1]